MSARRRRKRRSAAASAPSAPPAQEAPEKPSKARGSRGQSKGGRRRGLGRGFWLYMVFMMAVLIPLNLFCLNTSNQGPGQSAEAQPVIILDSTDDPHEPYLTDPPTSGPHVRELAGPGFSNSTLPDEIQVANLDAGYVIVHFNPAAGPVLEAEMQQLALELEGEKLIVQPDRNLGENQVAMTAWGRIELLETYDKSKVYAFVRTFSRLDFRTGAAPASGQAGS